MAWAVAPPPVAAGSFLTLDTHPFVGAGDRRQAEAACFAPDLVAADKADACCSPKQGGTARQAPPLART